MSKNSQIYLPVSNVKSTDFRRIYRLDQMRELDPVEFENFVGYLFKEAEKWRVETTKASGDEGIDLFLFKDGRMAVVQCKRYQKNVAASHVRELFGAMIHAHASKGYVVTTGTISGPSREWVKDKAIKLIDGVELEKWARRVNPYAQTFQQLSPQPVASSIEATQPMAVSTQPLARTQPQPPVSTHLPLSQADKILPQPKANPDTPKRIMYLTLTLLVMIVLIALLANFSKAVSNTENYQALASTEKNTPLATNPAIPTANPTPLAGANLNIPANFTVIPTNAPVATFTPQPVPITIARLKDVASEPCFVGQIKGNTLTHFYHLPGWYYYTSFNINTPNVKCFDNEAEAQAAGYKPGRKK